MASHNPENGSFYRGGGEVGIMPRTPTEHTNTTMSNLSSHGSSTGTLTSGPHFFDNKTPSSISHATARLLSDGTWRPDTNHQCAVVMTNLKVVQEMDGRIPHLTSIRDGIDKGATVWFYTSKRRQARQDGREWRGDVLVVAHQDPSFCNSESAQSSHSNAIKFDSSYQSVKGFDNVMVSYGCNKLLGIKARKYQLLVSRNDARDAASFEGTVGSCGNVYDAGAGGFGIHDAASTVEGSGDHAYAIYSPTAIGVNAVLSEDAFDGGSRSGGGGSCFRSGARTNNDNVSGNNLLDARNAVAAVNPYVSQLSADNTVIATLPGRDVRSVPSLYFGPQNVTAQFMRNESQRFPPSSRIKLVAQAVTRVLDDAEWRPDTNHQCGVIMSNLATAQQLERRIPLLVSIQDGIDKKQKVWFYSSDRRKPRADGRAWMGEILVVTHQDPAYNPATAPSPVQNGIKFDSSDGSPSGFNSVIISHGSNKSLGIKARKFQLVCGTPNGREGWAHPRNVIAALVGMGDGAGPSASFGGLVACYPTLGTGVASGVGSSIGVPALNSNGTTHVYPGAVGPGFGVHLSSLARGDDFSSDILQSKDNSIIQLQHPKAASPHAEVATKTYDDSDVTEMATAMELLDYHHPFSSDYQTQDDDLLRNMEALAAQVDDRAQHKFRAVEESFRSIRRGHEGSDPSPAFSVHTKQRKVNCHGDEIVADI